jgi:ABC-type multidrug transport system permease subunit
LVQAALGPTLVEAEVNRGVEAGVTQILTSIEQGQDVTQTQQETVLLEDPEDQSIDPNTEQVTESDPSQEQDAGESTEQDVGQDSGLTTGDEEPGSEPVPPVDESGSEEPPALRKFFTAAIKGIVSEQVQESLENPQVQLAVLPFEAQENIHRPSLLDYLVPGYSLMFVFFLIPSLALTVIEEREAGTLRRLLVAPVPRSRILLGKMIPYFLIAVLQLVTVLLASKFLFGIDLGGSLLALFFVILCSALVMSALGILIASFAQTDGQADGLSLVAVLTMAVISGAMFPSISIPGLQLLTPHYWAMQGFLNVIARGQGVESVLLPIGILLTMAAVFFTIGAVRFRFE